MNKKKLTFDDMRMMFPDMGADEINWLVRASEAIRTGSHTHHNLMHMKNQSLASSSPLQNAKASIIDYYLTGKMTKNTGNPIPEIPKIETEERQLTDLIVCKRYVQLCENAKERNIQFSLSISDVKQLLSKKKCHYTGLLFDHSNPDFRPSFDRIDKNKGYLKENVVVCMTAINHLKNDLIENSGALFFENPELLLKTVESIYKTMMASR